MTDMDDISGLDFEPELDNTLTTAMLLRWFAYDFAHGSELINSLLGLPPVTEEGHSMELAQSAKRLEKISPLVAFFGAYSMYIGPVMASLSLQQIGMYAEAVAAQGGEFDSVDTAVVLSGINQQLYFHTFMAIFAAAIEAGLIDAPQEKDKNYEYPAAPA